MRVREAKLCHGKDSATIALGIELGVVDVDLGDMYRLMIQVNFQMLIELIWYKFQRLLTLKGESCWCSIILGLQNVWTNG